jgi:hypothetical protein
LKNLNAIRNSKSLFYVIPFPLQAGAIGPVIFATPGIILGSLLLGILLPFIFLAPPLISSPHATNHGATHSTSGRSFARIITGNSPSHSPYCGAPRCSAEYASFSWLFSWWWRRRLGPLHRIESGLPFCPLVTVILIPFHLLLTLPLAWKDIQVIGERRANDKRSEKRPHDRC